jgi:hypothetical protein
VHGPIRITCCAFAPTVTSFYSNASSGARGILLFIRVLFFFH